METLDNPTEWDMPGVAASSEAGDYASDDDPDDPDGSSNDSDAGAAPL